MARAALAALLMLTACPKRPAEPLTVRLAAGGGLSMGGVAVARPDAGRLLTSAELRAQTFAAVSKSSGPPLIVVDPSVPYEVLIEVVELIFWAGSELKDLRRDEGAGPARARLQCEGAAGASELAAALDPRRPKTLEVTVTLAEQGLSVTAMGGTLPDAGGLGRDFGQLEARLAEARRAYPNAQQAILAAERATPAIDVCRALEVLAPHFRDVVPMAL